MTFLSAFQVTELIDVVSRWLAYVRRFEAIRSVSGAIADRKYRRCCRARQRYRTSGWLDQERVKTTNDGGGPGQVFRPVKSPGERREHSSNLFVALRSIQAAIVPRSDDSRRFLSPSLLSPGPLFPLPLSHRQVPPFIISLACASQRPRSNGFHVVNTWVDECGSTSSRG